MGLPCLTLRVQMCLRTSNSSGVAGPHRGPPREDARGRAHIRVGLRWTSGLLPLPGVLSGLGLPGPPGGQGHGWTAQHCPPLGGLAPPVTLTSSPLPLAEHVSLRHRGAAPCTPAPSCRGREALVTTVTPHAPPRQRLQCVSSPALCAQSAP